MTRWETPHPPCEIVRQHCASIQATVIPWIFTTKLSEEQALRVHKLVIIVSTRPRWRFKKWLKMMIPHSKDVTRSGSNLHAGIIVYIFIQGLWKLYTQVEQQKNWVHSSEDRRCKRCVNEIPVDRRQQKLWIVHLGLISVIYINNFLKHGCWRQVFHTRKKKNIFFPLACF